MATITAILSVLLPLCAYLVWRDVAAMRAEPDGEALWADMRSVVVVLAAALTFSWLAFVAVLMYSTWRSGGAVRAVGAEIVEADRGTRASTQGLAKALVRLLYQNVAGMSMFNALAAWCAVAFAVGLVEPLLLVGWGVAVSVVGFGRATFASWLQRSSHFLRSPRRDANRFAFGCFVQGLVFGAGFVLLAPELDIMARAAFVVITIGLAAGSTSGLAADRVAFSAYTMPLVGCVIGWLLLDAFLVSSMESLVLAVVLASVVGVLTGMHGFLFTYMADSLLLAGEKAMLAGQLEEANELLAQDRRELEHRASTDALTGLANRRELDAVLEREWRRCERHQLPLGCVLLDIDQFKAFNDNYGHARGDEVLRAVAGVLESTARRPGDLVARYGGEEFVVVLPGVDGEGVHARAEAMRMAVAEAGIAHAHSFVAPHVTVSLGCASTGQVRAGSPRELLVMADRALYEAKESGRNATRLARTESTLLTTTTTLSLD